MPFPNPTTLLFEYPAGIAGCADDPAQATMIAPSPPALLVRNLSQRVRGLSVGCVPHPDGTCA
jgi:hypothetical protein